MNFGSVILFLFEEKVFVDCELSLVMYCGERNCDYIRLVVMKDIVEVIWVNVKFEFWF